MHDIALILTLRMTEGEAYVPTPYGWLVKPTEEQVRLLPFLEITGLVLVWLFGIAWVLTLWRAAPPVGTPAGWQAVPRGQDL